MSGAGAGRKMSKIYIVPKHQFDGILTTNDSVKRGFADIAFISICEPDSDLSCDQSYFKSDSENVLRVFVHDITGDLPYLFENSKRANSVAKALTPEQAEQIVLFVEQNIDKKVWLIHCTAGISRSGAVGTYVSERIGMGYGELKRENPQIIPNQHILSMLRKVPRKSPA